MTTLMQITEHYRKTFYITATIKCTINSAAIIKHELYGYYVIRPSRFSLLKL